MTEADLRTRLAAAGLSLRDDEVAPVLLTARFLARAADLVREAARP